MLQPRRTEAKHRKDRLGTHKPKSVRESAHEELPNRHSTFEGVLLELQGLQLLHQMRILSLTSVLVLERFKVQNRFCLDFFKYAVEMSFAWRKYFMPLENCASLLRSTCEATLTLVWRDALESPQT